MATAADVPGKYDVVINGAGYLFADIVETSLPFRYARAQYSYSPTFIERQNTQGNYGDNQQDFWLTWTQRDWSLGEDQRWYRGDDTASRKYWAATGVDVSTPGQVGMSYTKTSGTTSSSASSFVMGPARTPGGDIQYTDVTNLYIVNSSGTETSQGAHGLGAAPTTICSDGANLYLSTTAAGTVGVRKWTGAAYSTFSATGADSLAYLNNTLYGYQNTTGKLIRYDAAGAVTTLFTWQDAAGTFVDIKGQLVAYGGRLAILARGQSNEIELWIYDGVGVNRVASFGVAGVTKTGQAIDKIVVSNGIIYVAATVKTTTKNTRRAIYYYANGTYGILWESQDNGTTIPMLAPFAGGIIFTDVLSLQKVRFYDPATGAISTIALLAFDGNGPIALGATSSFFAVRGKESIGGEKVYIFPGSTAQTNVTVDSSLIDFDTSLTKQFRGIKVDFDSASDGDGGSVDIAYQTENLANGSYTTLQTGAAAGTEYTLSSVSGRSLSIRITLNKGTSTLGPTLKRVYLRAVPVLQQFRHREYILDLTPNRKLRDDVSYHPNTGREQADLLVTAAQQTTPFSITDRFGTFTGIIDLNDGDGFQLSEIHPATGRPTKSGAFLARIRVREV